MFKCLEHGSMYDCYYIVNVLLYPWCLYYCISMVYVNVTPYDNWISVQWPKNNQLRRLVQRKQAEAERETEKFFQQWLRTRERNRKLYIFFALWSSTLLVFFLYSIVTTDALSYRWRTRVYSIQPPCWTQSYAIDTHTASNNNNNKKQKTKIEIFSL